MGYILVYMYMYALIIFIKNTPCIHVQYNGLRSLNLVFCVTTILAKTFILQNDG